MTDLTNKLELDRMKSALERAIQNCVIDLRDTKADPKQLNILKKHKKAFESQLKKVNKNLGKLK